MAKVLITIMVSVSGFVLGGDFLHPLIDNADSSKIVKNEKSIFYNKIIKPFDDLKFNMPKKQEEINTIEKLDKIIENLKKQQQGQTIKPQIITERK